MTDLTETTWVGAQCPECNTLNPLFNAGEILTRHSPITARFNNELVNANANKPLCQGCGGSLAKGNVCPCYPPDSPLNVGNL